MPSEKGLEFLGRAFCKIEVKRCFFGRGQGRDSMDCIEKQSGMQFQTNLHSQDRLQAGLHLPQSGITRKDDEGVLRHLGSVKK